LLTLAFKVRRDLDDVDRIKGAFLDADTATDTQLLRDEGKLGLLTDLDAHLACEVMKKRKRCNTAERRKRSNT
jgi:hypothetical protein